MLRDITLGQYYPVDSVLHRMDPRTKLFGTMVFIISLFVADSIWAYLVATLFLAMAIRLSHVPFKFMVRGLKAVSYTHLAAVSQVKIDGVLHEFSSIPGVKEDVTEIIMNIKSLAIKNNSDTNEAKVAYIEFEGEGVVTAADIQADPDIEIMNPDQVIATLSSM